MSPRLSRIGAHGVSIAGRNRYWLALLGAASTDTNLIGSAFTTDGRLVVGCDLYPGAGASDRIAWAVLTRSGALVADVKADSADDSYPTAVAAGDAGSAYVVGLAYASPIVAECLYKIDAAGSVIWSAGEDTNYRDVCESLAASGSYLYGTDGSGRLVRLSTSDGSLVWWIDPSETLLGVSCDSSGNAYVVGRDGTDVVLAKVDSSGAVVWGVTIADSTATGSSGKAVLVHAGYVYILAGFSDGVDYISFVSKYDTSGAHQWTTPLTYIGYSGLAVDDDGNVFAGDGQVFVKLNSSGALQWSREFIGASLGSNSSLHLDGDALMVSGWVSGTTLELDFGFAARVPLDGSGTGVYPFVFVGDDVSIEYAVGTVSTASNTITTASRSLSLTTSTTTSPVTPDSTTNAGLSRAIATV